MVRIYRLFCGKVTQMQDKLPVLTFYNLLCSPNDNPMTIDALMRGLKQNIESIYGDRESTAIAKRLVMHFTGLETSEYLLARQTTASTAIIQAVNEVIPLLIRQVPVQYIIGNAHFCDLNLLVKPGVLIPRPETEELVMKIIKDIGITLPNDFRVLDIGTGSGAIAIALAQQWDKAQVYAVDVSLEALTIAGENAAANQVIVDFQTADILKSSDWAKLPGNLNLIVSNPPYATISERAQMHPNVTDHEPELALFVSDEDPLVFYRAIARFAKNNLLPGGKLWFEINEQYPDEMYALLTEEGFADISISMDFRDKMRFASAINQK